MAVTVITPENQGPIVNVVQWVFMVTMIIAVLTKLTSKWQRAAQFGADDLFLTAAMLFAVGQTVAVSQQVTYGLGNGSVLREPGNRDKYQKAGYASEILYVTSLCFSKLATVAFVQSLAPIQWLRTASTYYMGAIGIWTFASIFAVAFQCSLPTPWAIISDQCFDQLPFWAVYGALDISTEVILVVIPSMIVRGLQTKMSHKLSVITSFAVRLVTVPLIILRLVYLAQAINNKNNPYKAVNAAIITSIQMNTAIVAACVPFIKVILERMQHGFMTSDLVHGSGGIGGTRGKSGYNLSNLTKSNKSNPKSGSKNHSKSDSTQRLEGESGTTRGSSDNEGPAMADSIEVRDSPRRVSSLGPGEVHVRTTIATSVTEAQSPPKANPDW